MTSRDYLKEEVEDGQTESVRITLWNTMIRRSACEPLKTEMSIGTAAV